jgi:hypothetical protein
MYDAGWHEVSYEKCSSYEEAKEILEKHLDENIRNCGDIVIL